MNKDVHIFITQRDNYHTKVSIVQCITLPDLIVVV